uniref:GATA-type domain-containing protein n=1 Tax=Haemonchus contortus TaxID=6289 RepID=A0A7I4Y3Z3_HAECO|nr:Bromo adjacent region and ELM2 and Zinc finger domain containing protein [Haemonchus contortus]
MTEDGELSRSPDQNAQAGLWEVEPLYYSIPGRTDRSRRGKAYRKRTDGEICCFEAHDGVVYKPGDTVYIEATPSDPYVVGSITMFKMTKRDMLSVKVSRFYRPEDVPEVSLSLISQERLEMNFSVEPSPEVLSRELFTSDTTAFHSISSLRGKCTITFVKDIRSLGDCDLSKDNTFFSCLSYNQESSRLASVQGEIRVGASYQAKLPAEASCSVADEPDRDELLYRPGMIDPSTEDKYIKLARSFRMFAMMETRMMDTEKHSRVSDLLFDDALTTLHRCGYKFDEALKEMNANDKLLSADANFMTVDDTKKFCKGIKTIGKNFMRISRELLPLHSRDQLVGFYYLWKKTSDAVKPKPLSRQRNQVTSIKRTAKNAQNKTSRPASTELLDYASASEGEMETLDAEKAAQYACHHCYGSKSRDWHHAGRDGLLLCSDCRLFYKKYGQLRPVDRPSTVPPCLFKRSPSCADVDEDSGVRTRAGKKERRRTPSMGEERRSPSQAASIHEFDLDKVPINKTKNGKRKRSNHVHSANGLPSNNNSAKKKREDADEDSNSGKEEVNAEENKATTAPSSVKRENDTTETPAATSPVSNEKSRLDTAVAECERAAVMKQEPDSEKPLEKLEQVAMMVEDVKPETASVAEPKKEEKIFDDIDFEENDENVAAVIEDDNTWKHGDQEACTSKNAIFVQSIVRSCGQMSARTDLSYRMPSDCEWARRKREKKEKAAAAAAAQQQPATPTQPKKAEMNGMMPGGIPDLSRVTAMNGQMPMFHGMDPMTVAMMQQMQQAQLLEAQQHAAAQQQHMMKMEMQRQLAAAGRIPIMSFMDQRMAAAAGLPFMPTQQPTDMQRFQMEMMQAQQMAGAMSGAMGHPQALANPEIQALMMQMMMANQMSMPQMGPPPMQAPTAMTAGLPPSMGLHPALIPSSQANGLMTNSDMMRRLQQEGFPMRPQ